MTFSNDKPLLRGYFHLGAAIAAVFGCVGLMLLADSPTAYVGGSVFAASLIALYSVSATYHTIPWGRRMQAVLKRADHAMIFVLIAGSYTPLCLLALGGAWGIALLAVVWTMAAFGIAMKIAWPNVPRWLSVGVYMGMGWLGVLAATQNIGWFELSTATLLIGGGLLYTIGGVIYALRRPNPFPRVFGYHEVFHLLVIGGSVLHYTLVAAFLMRA